MKKETARAIKMTVASMAVLAAVLCYNMDWSGQGKAMDIEIISGSEEDIRSTHSGEKSETADTEAEPVPGAGGTGPGYKPDNGDTVGSADTGRIFIHVCGEVKNPGVYELEAGSRIYQAVDMAGGFTENAAKNFLNMARALEDGMKIQVPSHEEADNWTSEAAVSYFGVSDTTMGEADAGAKIPASPVGENTLKVNLNTATKEQLMTLKGIGESRAEAIISYRQESGPFGRIEDIMEVSGIKEAAFQKIKDDITV